MLSGAFCWVLIALFVLSFTGSTEFLCSRWESVGIFTRIKALLCTLGAGRDVVLLSGSTAVGQLLALLVSPILTRLYMPEDYGILGVVSSVLGILSVIGALRYELAIPLPEDDDEAAAVLCVSLGAVAVVSLSSVVAVTIWGEEWARWTNVPPRFVLVIPIGVLLIGLYQLFYYWTVRMRSFSTVAATRITQSGIMLAAQLGFSSLGALGLIVGHLLGQMAGVSTLIRRSISQGALRFRSVTLPGLVAAARRYKRFPLLSTWEGLFNSISMQLPPLVMAAVFGPSAAGIYNLAHRVSNVPVQLIGRAIGDVFYSRAAVAYREQRLQPVVQNLVNILIAVAAPPAVVLAFTAPQLFSLIFGEVWREAGVVAQFMVPWIFLVFVGSPLTLLFSILEKQFQGALFQSVLLIARVLAILFGASVGGFMSTVVMYALVSASCWAGLLVWSMLASGNSVRTLFSALGDTALRLAPAVSILIAATVAGRFFETEYPFLAGVALSAVWMVGYYWRLIKAHNLIAKDSVTI